MKLIYSYGCLANELSVNGIQEVDLTDKQRKEVINRIFQWYDNHPAALNNLLQYFIETHCDDYDCTEPCECCGDMVTTYKMEI
jgi:hypothetical protein